MGQTWSPRFSTAMKELAPRPKDHAWLDSLTRERASHFAARHGYDLKDYVYGGWVSDWWGFTWMPPSGSMLPPHPSTRQLAHYLHGFSEGGHRARVQGAARSTGAAERRWHRAMAMSRDQRRALRLLAAAPNGATGEAQTRRMVGHVSGREEKYTEILRTNLERSAASALELGPRWPDLRAASAGPSSQHRFQNQKPSLGVSLAGWFGPMWKRFQHSVERPW